MTVNRLVLAMAPGRVGGGSPSLACFGGELPPWVGSGGLSDTFPVVSGALEDVEWGDVRDALSSMLGVLRNVVILSCVVRRV